MKNRYVEDFELQVCGVELATEKKTAKRKRDLGTKYNK